MQQLLEWPCEVCTYLNVPDRNSCEMCFTKRGCPSLSHEATTPSTTLALHSGETDWVKVEPWQEPAPLLESDEDFMARFELQQKAKEEKQRAFLAQLRGLQSPSALTVADTTLENNVEQKGPEIFVPGDFTTLPYEVLEHVLGFMEVRTLGWLASTSRMWRELVQGANVVWKNLFCACFGSTSPPILTQLPTKRKHHTKGGGSEGERLTWYTIMKTEYENFSKQKGLHGRMLWACTRGYEALFRELIVTSECEGTLQFSRGGKRYNLLETRNEYGQTLLIVAAEKGYTEIVRTLLQHGARKNATDSREGQTALLVAVVNSHLDIIQLLLTHGVDVSVASRVGWTPLAFASYRGYCELARLLLAYNADVNQLSANKQTCLHKAAEGNQPEIIEMLVAAGAHVYSQDVNKETPLDVAVDRHHVEAVRALHKANADTQSALTRVIERKDERAIEILLSLSVTQS
ncbi:hypothetical protein QOT17_015902 [Balamuthia mandrillaris]